MMLPPCADGQSAALIRCAPPFGLLSVVYLARLGSACIHASARLFSFSASSVSACLRHPAWTTSHSARATCCGLAVRAPGFFASPAPSSEKWVFECARFYPHTFSTSAMGQGLPTPPPFPDYFPALPSASTSFFSSSPSTGRSGSGGGRLSMMFSSGTPRSTDLSRRKKSWGLLRSLTRL